MIGECSSDDLAALAVLENECFSSPYTLDMLKSMLTNPLTVALKVVLDGEITGYIALGKACDEAELIKIAVKSVYRRGGVGRQLLESAIERLINAGIKKLFLEVDEINQAALNLYKSFGFSIISIRKKYYGDRAAVIMQKIL